MTWNMTASNARRKETQNLAVSRGDTRQLDGLTSVGPESFQYNGPGVDDVYSPAVFPSEWPYFRRLMISLCSSRDRLTSSYVISWFKTNTRDTRKLVRVRIKRFKNKGQHGTRHKSR